MTPAPTPRATAGPGHHALQPQETIMAVAKPSPAESGSAAPAPGQRSHTPALGPCGPWHLLGGGKSERMPGRPRQGAVPAVNRSVTSCASAARPWSRYRPSAVVQA